jgi:hypothetical protein
MQPRALAGVVTGALVSGVAAGATAAALARRRSATSASAPVQAATVLRSREDVEAHLAEHPLAGTRAVHLSDAPGDRGTEVRAELAQGASRAQLRDDVRRMKSLLETGTVVTVDGQPADRGPIAEGLTQAVTGKLRGVGAA